MKRFLFVIATAGIVAWTLTSTIWTLTPPDRSDAPTNSIAIGHWVEGTNRPGTNCIAIGRGAEAWGDNSVALGNHAIARDGELVLRFTDGSEFRMSLSNKVIDLRGMFSPDQPGWPKRRREL